MDLLNAKLLYYDLSSITIYPGKSVLISLNLLDGARLNYRSINNGCFMYI